ncbi:hypothetical protein ACH5RR_037319 [Cinchona calisaya]|uniref:Uncharacterized protein n=1 Tax=Cinchona calisaya TaxID=153742 RepID=A0ABD2YAL6_9GENT
MGVYDSSEDMIRMQQWEIIRNRSYLWGKEWMITSDFNDIVLNDEKWGGRVRYIRSFNDFKTMIQDNNLVDFGFEDHSWTRSNNWEGDGLIRHRLDRGFGIIRWIYRYNNAKHIHINNETLDHAILLIDNSSCHRTKKKRFIFDKRWINRRIQQVVQEAWHKEVCGYRMFRLTSKIKICRVAYSSGTKKGIVILERDC